MNILSLPPVDADVLLARVRDVADAPAAEFASPPVHLATGGEAVIEAFRLRGAPSRWSEPLVLRRILAFKDPAQVRAEAAAHTALRAAAFPAPDLLDWKADAEPLGAPFLILERLAGEMPLAAVTRPGALLDAPLALPGLIWRGLTEVPRFLGRVQSQLHALDPAPLQRALHDCGAPARALSFDARLADLAQRIDAASLDGLRTGLDWLAARVPEPGEARICHGDLVFTNLCVEAGRLTGVLDWSGVTLAEPAYDVAATLARLDSTIPGVPLPLRPVFTATQRLLRRRYLACYGRGRIDLQRRRYYDAYWILHELALSGARLREGAVADGAVEHRWLHPEAIDAGVARFRATTGLRLAPLRPAT